MLQIAGFFTGGSLAIRGGYKAARNGAISCAILLAVIEGVGIGFQKMFAGATKLEVCQNPWFRGEAHGRNTDNLRSGSSTTPLRRDETCIICTTISTMANQYLSTLLRLSVESGRVFLYALMTVSILGGGVPCNIKLGWLH